MIAGKFVGAIFSTAIGTVAGTAMPKSWHPYVALVDDFSTYTYIFSVEKSNIDMEVGDKGKWGWWHYFSLLRNYFTICIIRGIVDQSLHLFLNNNLESFDFVGMVLRTGPYLTESIFCLIIILAFYDVVNCLLGREFISSCVVMIRAFTSIRIFERYGAKHGQGNLVSMVKHDFFNGNTALLTYTVVDLIFRGNLSIIGHWIGFRLVFLIMPFFHLYYNNTSAPVIHSHIIQLMQTHLGDKTGDFYKHLLDGHLMMTLAVFFLSSFFFGPTLKYILNFFLK